MAAMLRRASGSVRRVNRLADLLLRPAARLGAAAQNALEVARFGGLQTGEEASPYDIVARTRMYRLRRYHAPAAGTAVAGPPVLLVPPMMLAADVYDVSPQSSAVAVLKEGGADPWVVDFGAPETEEGGLERTLTDHVVAVSDAVDRVRAATGRDVHLGGYSQGGMFCYQAAAYRRSDGLASLVTFGSPVDTLGALPFGIPQAIASRGAGLLADRVLADYALPAWASRLGFRLLDPVKTLRQQVDFVLALHDREALLPRERQFIEAGGWVAWPGPAMADFVTQFVAHNRMLSGGFVIEDRLVTLADVTLPVLTVVGEVDQIAPPRAVRAVRRAAPHADIYELALPAGHFGLVVGSTASRATWPVVAGWTRFCDEQAPLPAEVHRIGEDEPDPEPPVGTRVGVGLELAAGVGIGVARSVLGTATRAASLTRLFTQEAARQLPRLTRLERVQETTRISTGLLLDEQARDAPGAVSFLFGDRAHTQAAVKERIDGVVRGLLSLGVRQGEHVGVLMGTRPSALVVVAALNRLGAVAVLLRPDGATARELELGRCTRVVADPELARRASDAGADPVLVLGGGAQPRELGGGLVDMERIDPAAVDVPAWYRPNPGRAGDLAFVLFSGLGARTQINRVTNGRWAVAAFGTASSAALSKADTVYAVTPIYHPSGLLMSIGGAVAGGARLALAEGFDPETYWEEVRRYGVTVGAYTWTMLRALVERPPDRSERHHPVRLFIGSGMPRGLWRRVEERFAPARVLEFYASTEGEAVLVNVAGTKRGAAGRPLPGSAELRLAAYDAEAGRLRDGPDSFALPCPRGEAGMLLARERPGLAVAADSTLRGVFARDDAWLPTGDLFRQDHDGDFWRVGDVRALIQTVDGPVPALPISEALGELDAVDLAVAYGVRPRGAAAQIAVAAVTQRPRTTLTAADVARGLWALAPHERPHVVHVVREIPLTTWYRPLAAPLRARGLPRASRRAWIRDGDAYRPLTSADRARLTGRGGG
ncbi:MAG: putative long chain acyl-CoA synthase [Solirubrobacteraceae bacterium]|nr:putative long chain acyl-CoA synthase [Solirubrobacteraceae bacterium]